jgi:ACS family hexuronate transporter-like MFS transporter
MTTPQNHPPGSPGHVLTSRRWLICALLFAATLINYMDRQILSLLKPLLDQELHWTNEQFGWVNSLFQGAYAASYIAFGWGIDRYGTRIGYAVSIAAWSLAAAAHALVGSVRGFAIARIALGLGEGGNFPAAIKAVAQWFPRKERMLATTLFNSGANVGALLAPALIPPLAMAIGWHGTFLAAGAAGFVWLGFWLVLFEVPRRARGVHASELALIESDRGDDGDARPLAWREILGYRQTWGYILSRALTDPVWWFFLIWLPDYFKTSRGLDLKTMGLPLVVIYAIVTVLSIAGGWVAKRLVESGWSITRTRRACMLIFAFCVLPVALATRLPLWQAVMVIGLAGAAHQAWSATLYSTVSDIFPKQAVASIVGLSGLTSSLVGMIFPVVCGRVLDSFGSTGYAMLFGYCSVAYLAGFAINRLLCPSFDDPVAMGR